MSKHYLQDTNVLQAAEARIKLVFDHFDFVVVSFSGGKDSTVLLELARREAKSRGRQIHALFVDPEAQYAETILQIEETMLGREEIIPIWVCLPLIWRNGVSVFQPHWRTWDPELKDIWARPMPEHECVLNDTSLFPFWDENYGIDEVITEIPKWLCPPESGKTYASLVAIRTDESFHRYTAIKGRKRKSHWVCEDRKIKWSTTPEAKLPQYVNLYPIYDWGVEDVWKFTAESGIRHNRIYDRMYLAGVPLSEQRICQPYGDEQRRGLDQWAKIEPETWAAVLNRVTGVNQGARYSKSKFLGYHRGLGLPAGHTWQSYTFFLLSTLPDVVRERHLANFAIAIEWYMKKVYYKNLADIPDDETSEDNPSKFNIPSWRKFCLAVEKNDFWGGTLDVGIAKYLMRDIYDSVARDGVVVVRKSVVSFYEFLREQYRRHVAGEAIDLSFTHPDVDPEHPLKKKWKAIL